MDEVSVLLLNTVFLIIVSIGTLLGIVAILRDVWWLRNDSRAHLEVLNGILAQQRALTQVLLDLRTSKQI